MFPGVRLHGLKCLGCKTPLHGEAAAERGEAGSMRRRRRKQCVRPTVGLAGLVDSDRPGGETPWIVHSGWAVECS